MRLETVTGTAEKSRKNSIWRQLITVGGSKKPDREQELVKAVNHLRRQTGKIVNFPHLFHLWQFSSMKTEMFLAPLRGICREASSLKNVVIPMFSMSGMAREKKMSLLLHYFVDLQLVEPVRSNYIIKNINRAYPMNTNNHHSNSRRRFLKISALFSTAALVSPAVVRAQGEEAPSSQNGNSNNLIASRRRTLGTGACAMEVSPLGFGVMGMTYNRSQHPGREQCVRLLHEAVDRGVTLFDTAIIYGPLTNEILAGEALSPFKGKISVTTKFGHEVIDGKGTGRQDSRPETIRRYCDESLRRLKLDTIELFYQHRFDPKVPVEDVAGTISELIKEGKVRRWGMCEVTPGTIRKAHAVQPLTAIQSEYHLMHRDVESNGVLEACRELGIGFVPYSPINRGFLGGCINEYTQFDPNNDNRQTLPRFTPEALRANTRLVNVLQQFGRTRGMTSAQVALAWLLQKEPWIVPIPGTTKLAHLEENLRALDFSCTPQEWKDLENAVAAIPVTGARYNAEQQKQVGH